MYTYFVAPGTVLSSLPVTGILGFESRPDILMNATSNDIKDQGNNNAEIMEIVHTQINFYSQIIPKFNAFFKLGLAKYKTLRAHYNLVAQTLGPNGSLDVALALAEINHQRFSTQGQLLRGVLTYLMNDATMSQDRRRSISAVLPYLILDISPGSDPV
ncbi:unnamed protein product [Timema podura]|uniref:Uncharacterized protein n=1 Tax=Timema podura TaxID=61482 RepID=A0ABN7NVG6_TIMPD|nr:unnamed protein product [Timema podura]